MRRAHPSTRSRSRTDSQRSSARSDARWYTSPASSVGKRRRHIRSSALRRRVSAVLRIGKDGRVDGRRDRAFVDQRGQLPNAGQPPLRPPTQRQALTVGDCLLPEGGPEGRSVSLPDEPRKHVLGLVLREQHVAPGERRGEFVEALSGAVATNAAHAVPLRRRAGVAHDSITQIVRPGQVPARASPALLDGENPVRAGLVKSPARGEHTVQRRRARRIDDARPLHTRRQAPVVVAAERKFAAIGDGLCVRVGALGRGLFPLEAGELVLHDSIRHAVPRRPRQRRPLRGGDEAR